VFVNSHDIFAELGLSHWDDGDWTSTALKSNIQRC